MFGNQQKMLATNPLHQLFEPRRSDPRVYAELLSAFDDLDEDDDEEDDEIGRRRRDYVDMNSPREDERKREEEEVDYDSEATGLPEGVDNPQDLKHYLEDNAENLLACLFLVDPGNRATIKLLMRGMPVPCTFGFPGTNGTVWSNYREFVKQFHPSISIRGAHPLHPFTRKERFIVFLCTVAFNALWSAFTEYQRNHISAKLPFMTSTQRNLTFLFIKHVSTVIYAVVIRQLVICPCAYNALVNDIVDEENCRASDRELQERAKRLMFIKIVGDRILLWLFLAHFAAVACVIIWMSSWNYTSHAEEKLKSENENRPAGVLLNMATSELVNFFVWFVKFLPLFVILYPIHRAQWYQGGPLKDYLLCKRSLNYRKSVNYKNEKFPRRVEPETKRCTSAKMRTLVTDVFNFRRSRGGYHLSTFRRHGEAAKFQKMEYERVMPTESNMSAAPGKKPKRKKKAKGQSALTARTPPPTTLRRASSSSLELNGNHIGGNFDGWRSDESGLPEATKKQQETSRNDQNSVLSGSKLVPLRLASYLSSIPLGSAPRNNTRDGSTGSLTSMLHRNPDDDKDDDDDNDYFYRRDHRLEETKGEATTRASSPAISTSSAPDEDDNVELRTPARPRARSSDGL